MNIGLSDRIRAFAKAKYVNPAVHEGKSRFSIRVRDVNHDLRGEGFPPRHTPQICEALTGRKFLRENGLEIEEIEGPPSKQSPTVVVRYRVANPAAEPKAGNRPPDYALAEAREETPEEWAHRLTEKISGLLKEELAEYGGGEAFVRRVRGYDEEDAA